MVIARGGHFYASAERTEDEKLADERRSEISRWKKCLRHNLQHFQRNVSPVVSYFLDRSAIDVIQSIAQKASPPNKSIWATVIGVALALFGASGVFGQLQDS